MADVRHRKLEAPRPVRAASKPDGDTPLPKRDLLTLWDLTPRDVTELLDLATDLKEAQAAGRREPILSGHLVALLFEKPSLRTRVSFEAAISHLGGSSNYLGDDVGWGERESLADFARALSRYADVIVYRGSDHAKLEALAESSRCPVINGLTREAHPCQALGDLLTLREHWGELAGRKLAFVGDANNVSRSLALAAAMMGMRLAIACPAAYAPPAEFLKRIYQKYPSAAIEVCHDSHTAVAEADAVYTDVWVSMGDEADREVRESHFADFQVNEGLMRAARPHAIFLHCLPARRGVEVTSAVMDSPQSKVFDQAENRLHIQKAVLVWLLTADHPKF